MIGSFQPADKHIESDQISDKNFESINLEKLELMMILQSTLNLKSQLKFFLENLRKKLRIDGLCFVEESRQLKIKIGKQATHSCGYHITKGDHECGELILKRSTRFSEQDLEVIEGAILLLLVPISNALKYQDAIKKSSLLPSKDIVERQFLMNTLNREIELAKRHNHPLSLLNLKVTTDAIETNKNALENILPALCKSFQTVSNETDMWFRISTSEFLLLTHNALENAQKIARDFQQLENTRLYKDFVNGNIKIKAGVASLTGTDSVNSLIKRSQQPIRCSSSDLI